VVHQDLEALLALQEKDRLVTGSELALAALEPEQRRLNEQLAASERALQAAQRSVEDALRRRDELEGKISSYRTMQEQRRQRLEWVRGAKEASTLMAELDLARSVLAKEEAEFMRSRRCAKPRRPIAKPWRGAGKRSWRSSRRHRAYAGRRPAA
jgi:hypothetical protein